MANNNEESTMKKWSEQEEEIENEMKKDENALLLETKDEDDEPTTNNNNNNNIESQSITEKRHPKLEYIEQFSDILKGNLLKGVLEKYNKPTQIQQVTLPIMLGTNKAENLIAQAKSGSGKTGAFSLGMLSHVDPKVNSTQAIIICPTMELTDQVYVEVCSFAKYMIANDGLKVCLLIKDPNEKKNDNDSPNITDHVIVGTLGKIHYFINNNKINLKNMRVLVIDEADQFFDNEQKSSNNNNNTVKSDLEKIKMIKNKMKKDVRIFLFSATFPISASKIAKDIVSQSVEKKNEKRPYKYIWVKLKELRVDEIIQYKIDLTNEKSLRLEVIKTIFQSIQTTKIIVFFNRIDVLEKIKVQIQNSELRTIPVFSVHSKILSRRDEMKKFREATTGILLTTNVLARGIDIEGLNIVINYDLPTKFDREDIQSYIHRIGRTGRIGYHGIAINFLHNAQDVKIIESIEKKTALPIKPLKLQSMQKQLEQDEQEVEEKNRDRKSVV